MSKPSEKKTNTSTSRIKPTQPPQGTTDTSISHHRTGRGSSSDKRARAREERRRRQLRERWLIIGGISVVAISLAALLIVPTILKNQPVEVIVPTPNPRPQAAGLTMGNPNALVTVEEFSDFNCPHCREYAIDQEPQIVADYIATGKVYFKYFAYPFMASTSTAAAEASYCASEQNKFWEYQDILWANNDGTNSIPFNDENLITFAKKLDLNVNDFQTCYEQGKYRQQVLSDKAYGASQGVTGTPSFLVNGKLVNRGELVATIEEALAASSPTP